MTSVYMLYYKKPKKLSILILEDKGIPRHIVIPDIDSVSFQELKDYPKLTLSDGNELLRKTTRVESIGGTSKVVIDKTKGIEWLRASPVNLVVSTSPTGIGIWTCKKGCHEGENIFMLRLQYIANGMYKLVKMEKIDKEDDGNSPTP